MRNRKDVNKDTMERKERKNVKIQGQEKKRCRQAKGERRKKYEGKNTVKKNQFELL